MMMVRLAIAVLVAACGGAPPHVAAPPPQEPARTVTPPPPPPKGTPFGRFTAVQPDGYKLDARGDNIAFERDGIMIALIDGADQDPPAAAKCLSMLSAFATGMVTGLARAAMTIDVVAGTPLPNGCRLAGSTADGQALVEAAVLDLGGGGVALAILLHKRADDGGGPAFQRVVASVRRP